MARRDRVHCRTSRPARTRRRAKPLSAPPTPAFASGAKLEDGRVRRRCGSWSFPQYRRPRDGLPGPEVARPAGIAAGRRPTRVWTTVFATVPRARRVVFRAEKFWTPTRGPAEADGTREPGAHGRRRAPTRQYPNIMKSCRCGKNASSNENFVKGCRVATFWLCPNCKLKLLLVSSPVTVGRK